MVDVLEAEVTQPSHLVGRPREATRLPQGSRDVIAVYIRISDPSKQKIDSQEADIASWLTAYAGTCPVERYVEKYTGKVMNRPVWKKVQEDMDRGRIGTLVVWRLDRLGRNVSGLTRLFEEMIQRRINFVSVRDHIDLSTPAGRLIANVLASVAFYENELRGDRIRAGRRAAISKGKVMPRPDNTGKRLSVTPEQIQVIKDMHAQALAAGQKRSNKFAMMRATGLNRGTVYSVLREIGAMPAKPMRKRKKYKTVGYLDTP